MHILEYFNNLGHHRDFLNYFFKDNRHLYNSVLSDNDGIFVSFNDLSDDFKAFLYFVDIIDDFSFYLFFQALLSLKCHLFLFICVSVRFNVDGLSRNLLTFNFSQQLRYFN